MKRTTLLSIGSALVAIGVMSVAGYGCGDDDDVAPKPDSGTQETSTPPPPPPPPPPDAGNAPPTLGAQIDRLGRPAINTALTGAFNPSKTAADMLKNAYNGDSNAAAWVATHRAEIGGNLAVLDALDEVCGNQLAAADGGAAPTNALVYGPLAGFLADDRLWMNTAGTTANQYLAVEGAALGVTAFATDRGGRALGYDVIDTTYAVLATGNPAAAVGDGIAKDPAKTDIATFPYLAPGQ